MRWKHVLRKLNPTQLIDIFIVIILEILNIWALIRLVLVLALVLTIVISNLIPETAIQNFKGLIDENINMVDWMHSTNK